jgi:hypothetical protein
VALNDDATLVIGAGNFFTAAVNTAIPADLAAPGVAWENVGHTSLEDIFASESEGGEATTLGTLQNKTLRTKYSDRIESFTFTLQQWDEDSLKLYFGSNATIIDGATDILAVPTSPEPTTAAFLAVFIDGSTKFGLYMPKAELFRGDDLSLSDTESLAGLPIKVKPVQYSSNTWTYGVTPLS